MVILTAQGVVENVSELRVCHEETDSVTLAKQAEITGAKNSVKFTMCTVGQRPFENSSLEAWENVHPIWFRLWTVLVPLTMTTHATLGIALKVRYRRVLRGTICRRRVR